MSNVVNLAERRELLSLAKQVAELSKQIDAAENELAGLKMRLTPGYAKQVMSLVQSEQFMRYKDQWERLRPAFAKMFELALASQRVAGKPLDWEQAAALVFWDNGFITELDARVDAHIANLPSDATRFKDQLGIDLAPAVEPAPEPSEPVLTVVPTPPDAPQS
jgi:hypothetical protein